MGHHILILGKCSTVEEQGKLVDAPNIPHTREKIDVLSSIFSCMRNIYVFKKKMSCMPDIFSPQELHFNNELLEFYQRSHRYVKKFVNNY